MLLRRLRPAVVHTYNMGAFDAIIVAALAGVRVRIHAEHGRDVGDLDGLNRKYLRIRRILKPLVDCVIPVSRDLEQWMRDVVGYPPDKVRRIYNGVDVNRFHPPTSRAADGGPGPLHWPATWPSDAFVIGAVGRVSAVKDHATLIRAFRRLQSLRSPQGDRLRLVIVGDGALKGELVALVAELGLEHAVWLTGPREDVDHLMRRFAVFAVSSLVEGISLTILEAMASALPVVATRVGGNPELVRPGENGDLVPARDPDALAAALSPYLDDPMLASRHGDAGRQRVEREFSIETMIAGYLRLYDDVTCRPGSATG